MDGTSAAPASGAALAGGRQRAARGWRRWVVVGALVSIPGIWTARQAGTALVVAENIDRPDAIVSLASHEWERLPAAAALAGRMPGAKVLLTQPIALNAYNCNDCEHRVQRLEESGVARDRIELLPRKVFRTMDEAQAVREWAVARGARSLMVVTSPYHTRRSLDTFRHVLKGTGIAVGIYPSSESPADPPHWWRHKYDRWYVSYEWRARLFYLIRFGVR